MNISLDREDKIIYSALVISCLLHCFFFGSLALANRHPHPRLTKHIEVVYHQVQMPIHSQMQPAKAHEPQIIKEKAWTPDPKILSAKGADYTSVLNDIAKRPARLDAATKQIARVEVADGKRQVSVPLLESEKITNPKYLNYNDRIRNKIKNRAYFYVDDPKFQAGEVYLAFVVTANGELKAINIIDSKTKANDYLRSVGLRSIKESSPFPPFPADLKYPELSFNVVISFQINGH